MTDQPRDPATEVHRVADPSHTRVASYLANRDEVSRVLLLYSGGLDTSVMLRWIQDEYEAEVVALTVNLGQPGEDYEVVRGRPCGSARSTATSSTRARSSLPSTSSPRSK